MRLLLRLRAVEEFRYDLTYHKNLQGLIYSLIKDTSYAPLHDKLGCKFFSFSNILPPTQMVHVGSRKSLVVASPDQGFVESLMQNLKRIISQRIKIGQMAFTFEDFEYFEPRLPEVWNE